MSDVNPDDLLRVTLASIGDALVTTDAAGGVTYLNPIAEELTGWTQADARGRPLAEIFRIVNEHSRAPVDNPADRALREGVVVGLANHTVLIARDGVERPIDDSAAPIRDSAGTIVGVVLVFRDVTERRQRERDLKTSEARKAAVLDSALDGIVSIDHAGCVLEFNPAAERMFGHTADDARGRELAELIVPERFRDAHRRGIARYLETGEGPVLNRRVELTAVRSDGTEFPVEVSITPVAGDGPPTFTGYIRDITERKRAEQDEAERVRLTALRAEVAGALATADPLPDVLRRCCEAFVERLDVAFARVWALEQAGASDAEEGGTLALKASAGLYTHLDGGHARVPVGSYKIGRIARDRRPLLTNDVAHDPNISDPEWAQREGMVSFAGFPLLVEGRCVGVLAIFGRTALSDAVLDDLAPLAEQVAGFVDRKRVEVALRESELRYRMVGEAANDAIWDWDFANNRVTWNEGVRTRFGYAADQISPEADWWVEQIHPDDRDRVSHGIHAVIDGRVHDGGPGGGDNWQDEYRFRRADGGYATVFDRGRVVREDGRAVRMVGSMFDLTERKRAEETVRRSERRFRAAVESVGDIIWTNNARGEMEGEQPGWGAFTGQTTEQYQGFGWADAVHPEDAQPTVDAWSEAVAERREFNFEHRVRRRDGQWRLCTIRAVPVLDEAGEIAEWVGVHADVTEQRRDERRRKFLADLTAATQPLTDPDEVTATNARLLAEHLDADRCAYAEIEGRPAAEATFVITGDHARGVSSIVGRWPVAAFGAACAQAMEAGESYVFADAEADPRLGPDERPAYRVVDVRSAVCVPLHKGGRFIAAMAVHQTTPREWTAEEVELVETVVDRCWEALERARTTRRLAESEARYRSLFESMDEGFCLIEVLFNAEGRTEDYRILQMNPAFRKHTGLGDVVGQTAREFAPDLEPFWRETYGQVARTGEPVRFVNHAAVLDDRWFEVHAYRPGGADTGEVAVLFKDVSDRRQAEEDLRQSEERLRFLDALGEATRAEADPAAVMTAATRQLGEHLGVTRCAYADVEPDNDRFTIRDDWRAPDAATTAGTYSLDLFGVRTAADLRNGRTLVIRDVDTELDPADDGGAVMFSSIGIKAIICCPLVIDGRLRAMMAVHQAEPRHWTADEVSLVREAAERSWAHIERIRSAAALRASEQRLRFLMDSMPQKIFTATPSGEVDYFNPIWSEFTGLSFEKIREWGWLQFVHPDDVDENVRAWQRCVDSGEPFQFEHRFRRADGEYRWHLSRAVPMRDEAGRIGMWIGSNTEVHEVKLLQDELRKVAANLSEADRRKDEFLATLAHELRNPLAPIRSGLEVLRLAGDSPDAIAAVRETMERQTRQMTRLIDDLLDVSRITRGKLQLRRGRVELAEVVRSAVEAVRPALNEARHEFTLSLPEDPVPLDADAARLAQVFSNLLGNAIKYTPPGGRLSLAAAAAPESGGDGADGHGSQGAGEVIVSVRDNGLGIPAEKQESIFGMFNQLERDGGEEGYAGLGIGLTMVKSLVELHGGEVSVHSGGEGRGSEFRVRLPLLEPTPRRRSEPGSDAAGEHAVGRTYRVLVVDDNRAAARMLGMVVKMLGHEVRTAHDGLEAVSAAAEFRPALVLMDLGMPNLNGYEAARRIRDEPWGRDIVLAALTGWGQREDRRRTAEAGFDRHLVKPAEPAALRELFAVLDDAGPPES
ncbi:PAS domain S-box protein [Alienimonas chondri]|uniref:histidine kinase n=1 Tax=Alienimonas chondri TaxID=2681879 RepID=A0ABX1VFC7_9PLAN|nr:PAS domain S-box protein [Alienimonas chondri]NNJ26508.1 Sensor histidine kinase RcsC [Alienimonas chondri]